MKGHAGMQCNFLHRKEVPRRVACLRLAFGDAGIKGKINGEGQEG